MMTDRSAAATDFLRESLAGRTLDVAELEVKARAAGLLGRRQQIRHAKTFKKAKKSLGIRSIRDGFGHGGKWAWLLPPQPKPVMTERTFLPESDANELTPTAADDRARIPAELQGRRIPAGWVEGIARLDHDRAPADVILHRWRQFITDCYKFVSSAENWAERAAKLDWDARALFGCRRNRPLEHPSAAGLLWAVNGGKLLELHRDWALIERAQDGSRHVHHRRHSDAANVTLPWIGLRWAA